MIHQYCLKVYVGRTSLCCKCYSHWEPEAEECLDYIAEASLISVLRRITWFGAMPIFKAEAPEESGGASLAVPCALRSEKSTPTAEGRRWGLGYRRTCGRRSKNGSYVWRLAAKCSGFEKNKKNNNKTKTWKLKLREISWVTNFFSFLNIESGNQVN